MFIGSELLTGVSLEDVARRPPIPPQEIDEETRGWHPRGQRAGQSPWAAGVPITPSAALSYGLSASVGPTPLGRTCHGRAAGIGTGNSWGVNDPSSWQKLVYLSGVKAAPDAHTQWLSDTLAMPDRTRLGLLLAAPNAAMVATAGLITLLFLGDPVGLFLLPAAVLVLIAGAALTPFTRRRAEKVAARNGLAPPE